MECAVNQLKLLLAREPHEVDRVTGNADCEVRVFVGMIKRAQQHVAIQNVHVHVISRNPKKASSMCASFVIRTSATRQSSGQQCGCEGSAVHGVAVRDLGYRGGRCVDAVRIPSCGPQEFPSCEVSNEINGLGHPRSEPF